ncbi:MAG: putative bifunctional diguanylate cyclase/phosphodiesterase [Spirochaetota bacterium]
MNGIFWHTKLARFLAGLTVVSSTIFLLFRHALIMRPADAITYIVAGYAFLLLILLRFLTGYRVLASTMIVSLTAIGLYSQSRLPEPAMGPTLVLVTAITFSGIYYRLLRSLPLLLLIGAGYAIMGVFASGHPDAGRIYLPAGVNTLSNLWYNAGVAFAVIGVLVVAAQSYVMNALEQNILRSENLLTATRYQKRQLEDKERLLTLFTELASDYVYQVNLAEPDLVPEIFAGSFERTTGYTPEKLRQKGGWLTIVHPDDRPRLERSVPRLLESESAITEYRIISAAGRTVWLRDHVRPLRDEKTGAVTKLMGAVTDITERKAAEEQIENLAFYDPLTSLPNRRLLLDRLEQALALSARTAQHGALLFIDLDHFKNLNDTKGHEAGDQLLVQQARRLNLCVREGDTVARLGGDEFIIILGELSANAEEAAEETSEITRRILKALSVPVALTFKAMTDYENTCSIGVALFRGHEISVDELLRRADMAMYQAKADGRNLFRFFDPQMQRLLSERLALEEDLKHALAHRQLEIFLQPQITDGNQMIGAEVLLRWRHPERGMVAPCEFIPAAERTGLIVEIGAWVLEQACLVLKRWAARPATANLVLAVNVSARQFRQPDFVNQVRNILQMTGARGECLKLELTESLALENVEETIERMHGLRALGISIALDDFGTGQSSLSYLKRLPLNQLKIDQAFIRDIITDPNDAVLVQTIIGMAQNLNLDIIAEGVETEAQHSFLVSHGCPAYQGYLFSPPVAVAEFEQIFAA